MITEASRGVAFGVVAMVSEAITGAPRRLWWCVDLARDVGLSSGSYGDVTDPAQFVSEDDAKWCGILDRFRSALESHSGRVPISMSVRYVVCYTGRQIQCEFDLPYHVDVQWMTAAAPPAGVWRIVADYSRDGLAYYEPTGRGQAPSSFFFDQIPF